MSVKILGTEYETIRDALEKDYPKLKNNDGYTDFSIKQIVVADFEKDDSTIEDLDWYKKKILRHELVHAFINESGLAENCDWARNEELVDWIAIQFEKMLEIFIELDIVKIPNKAITIKSEIGTPIDKIKEVLNEHSKNKSGVLDG